MKNLLKIAALSSFAFFMASCGSANDVYGNSNSNNGVYRSSDGTVYRQGEIYRDRNGNIYQNGRVIGTDGSYGRPGVIVRNGGTNNVYYPKNRQRKLPPGQAKKIYGGNARDYAPGQVKKRSNANGNTYNGGFKNKAKRNEDQKIFKKNEIRKFENRQGEEKKEGFRK